MRVNHQENYHGRINRISSRPDVSAVWALTGVALLAACAHDGAGFFGTGDEDAGLSGGGGFNNPTATPWGAIFAAAAVAVLGAGAGGTGGTNVGPPPNRAPVLEEEPGFAVSGTAEHDAASDLMVRATALPQSGYQGAGQIGQGPSQFPFRASDPDNDLVIFDVTVPAGAGREGRSSETTPVGKFDENTFDYGSMVRGQYGTLFFNSATGAWTYEAAASKVNPIGSAMPAMEAFEITARDTRGAEAESAVPLRITITDGDEVDSQGVATWTSTGNLNAVKVGDRLTVTLMDDDGLPDLADITYEFFHDSDRMGADRTEIDDPLLAAATAADTGVVSVATGHVGKYIGVEITYTDLHGYDTTITEYANELGMVVVSADSPGAAAFDPGVPVEGAAQSVTVRLSDPNGVPASDVVYQFFYTDNADGTGTKVMLPSVTRMDDTNTAGVLESGFASLTGGIPTEAVGKYIGVEISYDDGVGDDGMGGTSDKVTEMMSQAVTAAPVPQIIPPRNYGPQIAASDNNYENLWVSLGANQHGVTGDRWVDFGERGYRNDPQHNPNSDLELTFYLFTSGTGSGTGAIPSGQLLSLASAPAWGGRGNVITEQTWADGTDMSWDTLYGKWRLDRVDERHTGLNNERELEGGVKWTYELGHNANQRAALANLARDQVEYDHLFLQVSDGTDSDIVRFSVQIRGQDVAASPPPRHIPDQSAAPTTPTAGPGASTAAPTLGLVGHKLKESATDIYVEGTHSWNWDSRNYHDTPIRSLYFGDDDTRDQDLELVFYQDSVVINRHNFAAGLGQRLELDMPTTYGKDPGFHPSYMDGSGDIAFYEYGQRGWYGTNGENAISPPTDGWRHIRGDYGTFTVGRFNDTGGHDQRDTTGRIDWTYLLHGSQQSLTVLGGGDNEQRANTVALDGDEWGVDMLHLQVYDPELNRSEVRTIMAVLEGRDGEYWTPRNIAIFTWEQSERPYNIDPLPTAPSGAPAQSPVQSPAYNDPPDSGHDTFSDGLAPTDYVII